MAAGHCVVFSGTNEAGGGLFAVPLSGNASGDVAVSVLGCAEGSTAEVDTCELYAADRPCGAEH